jgi:hypothetical protein
MDVGDLVPHEDILGAKHVFLIQMHGDAQWEGRMSENGALFENGRVVLTARTQYLAWWNV